MYFKLFVIIKKISNLRCRDKINNNSNTNQQLLLTSEITQFLP